MQSVSHALFRIMSQNQKDSEHESEKKEKTKKSSE